MCGIVGVLRLKNFESEVGKLIDRMTDTLEHRGPNDRGTWCDNFIALGSRRLSVIDLSSAGHMPMSNEDGSVQIVYNGEVYNFHELKEQYKLPDRGHIFRSRTDTEVLLHLYEEIGLNMASKLNGMFAIAIWDVRNKVLHLLRDRFGIKPLFYQHDEQYFRFGSEIKAIIADSRVPRKPSIQALHDFMTFDYIPGEQTAFEGIYELPPGHWLTVDTSGHIELQRFSDFSFEVDESIDENYAISKAFELMDNAVKSQLIADVPIGVLLSGGMDSSAIVALMNRHTKEPIRTYSVGFEEPSFNELPFARIVAKQFNAIMREVIITPQMVRDLLPKYLTYIDEPYGDGSAIPTYYVCQLAKDEVVVVLSGEGGDEVFAGYETYSAYKVSKWFRWIPHWLSLIIRGLIVKLIPASNKKLSLEFKIKRFLGGLNLPPAEAHLWWRIVLTESQKLKLYSSKTLEQFIPLPSERDFVRVYEYLHNIHELSKLMYIDSSIFLPDDLMVKNDRMSMAHSLEARVPMTDLELTGFMSHISPSIKFPGLRKKHIMRRALAGILPQEILDKKKVGLEIPYSFWLKNELNDLLLTYLSPEHINMSGLFQSEEVNKIIDDHLSNRVDNGRVLWGLLNYMMWLDLYIL